MYIQWRDSGSKAIVELDANKLEARVTYVGAIEGDCTVILDATVMEQLCIEYTRAKYRNAAAGKQTFTDSQTKD